MIDLKHSPVRAAGLVLFADDQKPPAWHVVPEQPSLVRLENGEPGFLLIKYRMDPSRGWPRGGGLLHLHVSLHVPDGALAVARQHLIAANHEMQDIVFLRADRATCELFLWPGETSSQTVVTAAPSAEPAFDASFHVPLSIEAVTLLEQALISGQSPATLVYRLSVTARRPQLPATATIDWRRTFEALRERGPAQPVSAESLADRLGPLIESGGIRIAVSGDDRAAVLERVTQEIAHIAATHLRAPAPPTMTEIVDFAQPRVEETEMALSATVTQLLGSLNVRSESLIALMEEISHG